MRPRVQHYVNNGVATTIQTRTWSNTSQAFDPKGFDGVSNPPPSSLFIDADVVSFEVSSFVTWTMTNVTETVFTAAFVDYLPAQAAFYATDASRVFAPSDINPYGNVTAIDAILDNIAINLTNKSVSPYQELFQQSPSHRIASEPKAGQSNFTVGTVQKWES